MTTPTKPAGGTGYAPADGSTFSFRYRGVNAGPHRLASGKKLCENEGCERAAEHIAEDDEAIYYVCDKCVDLIPNVKVLKSNTRGERTACPKGTNDNT